MTIESILQCRVDTNPAIPVIDEASVPTVLAEVQKAFFDIPFENSQFQTEAFVLAAQVTPERVYRAIGLQLHSKLQAIMEAKKGRALEDIDIEELQEKIDSTETKERDVRRARIELNFKLANRPYTDKLMNDALVELNLLYTHFKALPRFTREEFEAGEKAYFVEKLQRQATNVVGALEAQYNMDTDLPALLKLESDIQILLSSPSGSALENKG